MSNHRRSSFPCTHRDEHNARISEEATTSNRIGHFQPNAHPLGPSVNVNVSQFDIDAQAAPLLPATSIAEGLGGYQGAGPGLSGPNQPVAQVHTPEVRHSSYDVGNDPRPQFQHPVYDSVKLEPPGFEASKTDGGTYSIAVTTYAQNIPTPAFHHPQPHPQIPQHLVAFGFSGPGSQHTAHDPGGVDSLTRQLSVVIPEAPSPQCHSRDHRGTPHQHFSSSEQSYNPPPQPVPATPPIHGLLQTHQFYGHGHGHQSADQDPNQGFGAGAGSISSGPAGWLGHAGRIQQSPHSEVDGLQTLQIPAASAQGLSTPPGQPGPPPPGSRPPLHQPHFHAVPHSDQHKVAFRHHKYTTKRTLSVSSDQSVPYMTDLHLLLSPDNPDEGARRLQAGPDASRRSSETSAGREDPSPSKKRSNTQLFDSADLDDGSKKRIRGRPRVEPNDQTPADRRRTQIRLAQRAYRNRKEEALQTLEKKVEDLQKNNEEMSKAFMQLQDLAIKQGLLQSAPEFGRQLRATSERFLALAKVTEEEAKEDATSPEQDQDANIDESGVSSSSHQHQHMRISSSSPDASSISGRSRPQQPQLAFGSAPLSRDEASTRSHPIQAPFGYQVSAAVTSASAAGDLNLAVAPQTALDVGPYQADRTTTKPSTTGVTHSSILAAPGHSSTPS